MDYTTTKNEIFTKYNLNPENINVLGEIEPNDKNFIIFNLLKCYEFAGKNLKKGNLTASSYSCCLVLDDNTTSFGVNFNDTRSETSSICAERMAILDAFNSQVKNYTGGKFDYKIKYILMSSYFKEGVFWSNKITPCADCLSWFAVCKNLSCDTKICSLKKKPNGEIFLEAQGLDSFLPLRNLSYEIPTEIVTIEKSESAKNTTVSDENIKALANETLKAYKNNVLSKTSNQNIAAGVISNGEIFTGVKIDFSKRWFTEPLMAACYKAIEKFGLKTNIEAVCFFGEEYTVTESGKKTKDGIISIKTLGRIATRFAKSDTLVITGAKNGLYVRTIGDYTPFEHKFIQTYEIK